MKINEEDREETRASDYENMFTSIMFEFHTCLLGYLVLQIWSAFSRKVPYAHIHKNNLRLWKISDCISF